MKPTFGRLINLHKVIPSELTHGVVSCVIFMYMTYNVIRAILSSSAPWFQLSERQMIAGSGMARGTTTQSGHSDH
jgi:hypothetical protein